VVVPSTSNEHDARGHVRSRKNSGWSRRGFLSALTLASTAGFLGVKPNSFAAEPAPETKKLKLIYRTDALCLAPQYIAEERSGPKVSPRWNTLKLVEARESRRLWHQARPT